MRPTTHSSEFDLVEPVGIGTGLVEASSSLWKRAAERLSVSFGDLVRWAYDEQNATIDYSYKVTGELAIKRGFAGIDGPATVARVYLSPLRSLVASDRIEACTLLPFSGLLSKRGLLRRFRAWCPLCLASMLSMPPVYEPLLWRIRDVTACPVHRVKLVVTCGACRRHRQWVISHYSRVGCCNRCGAWMGTEDAALSVERADASEVKLSSAVRDLLAFTANFNGHEHDGHFTLRKIVTSRKILDRVASALGVPPSSIVMAAKNASLPRLTTLAALACASGQPLRQVIVGVIPVWRGKRNANIITLIPQPRRDWRALEREFKKLARGPSKVTLAMACKALKISKSSARIHFPELVSKIAKKRTLHMSKMVAAQKRGKMSKVRSAFRQLVASGVYPAVPRIEKLSGVDHRDWGEEGRVLLDEEWHRIAGRTNMTRRRRHTFSLPIE